MSTYFRKQPLSERVAAVLDEQIRAGRWFDWLPNERDLAAELHVSRATVRAALSELKTAGLIVSRQGLGTRIAKKRTSHAPNPQISRHICLLMPDSVNTTRPYLTLWIDDLKTLLFDSGYEFSIHTGHQYFRKGSTEAVRRLVEQQPAACWVLAMSEAHTQQWFADSGLACLLAGRADPQTHLPCVYLDLGALFHHATGRLLAAGHERLAVFYSYPSSPGVREAMKAFYSTLKRGGGKGEDYQVPLSTAEFRKLLIRLLRRKNRPTGMIVSNPMAYLTVSGVAQWLGLRIPEDLSLITTYGDPFLSWSVPAPTRYTYNPHQFAQKLLRGIIALSGNRKAPFDMSPVIPDFVPGETLGPPSPARADGIQASGTL